MSRVYCFHGLGASKKSFRILNSILSSEHEVYAGDFCGFGSRSQEIISGDPIKFCTNEFLDIIKEKTDICLIAHSMGSAIALKAANNVPEKIKSIILIEGNLISEDCRYLSREMVEKKNDKDLENFKHELSKRTSTSKYKGWQGWSKDIMLPSPKTLRSYSQSLIEKSDSGELLQIFKKLNCKKLYIYGDEYVDHPIINKLQNTNISYISGAGHFVMTDKPNECFKFINPLLF